MQSEAFRAFRESKSNCPCRDKSVEENMRDWSKMLDGTYKPGDAVVRSCITRLASSSMIPFKILTHDQPLTYKVWYFSISKRSRRSTRCNAHHSWKRFDGFNKKKQTLLYEHFGWTYPDLLGSRIHEWGGVKDASIHREW